MSRDTRATPQNFFNEYFPCVTIPAFKGTFLEAKKISWKKIMMVDLVLETYVFNAFFSTHHEEFQLCRKNIQEIIPICELLPRNAHFFSHC